MVNNTQDLTIAFEYLSKNSRSAIELNDQTGAFATSFLVVNCIVIYTDVNTSAN